MKAVVIILLCVIVMVSIWLAIHHRRPVGVLRIDCSDPNGNPYLFLELDADVYAVMRKKKVTFYVKLEDFVPHK